MSSVANLRSIIFMLYYIIIILYYHFSFVLLVVAFVCVYIYSTVLFYLAAIMA